MDKTGKLMIYGAVVLGVLLVRRAGGDSGSPIAPTRLERQVMKHKDLIWEMAVKYDTPPALIAAIMANESSGINQDARAITVRDYSGAEKIDYVVGLMQVRVDTAGIYCDLWHQHDLKDARPNVECGVKYLKAMLDKFDNIVPAVSAYNAGAGNVVMDTSMRGMEYVNISYIRNVLGMVQRFRLLFMGYKGANAYLMLFPPNRWTYEIP